MGGSDGVGWGGRMKGGGGKPVSCSLKTYSQFCTLAKFTVWCCMPLVLCVFFFIVIIQISHVGSQVKKQQRCIFNSYE